MNLETPGGLLAHLVTYVSSDARIIAHVQSLHGVTLTLLEVAQARRLRHRPLVIQYEPLGTTEREVWRRKAEKGDAAFVNAIKTASAPRM